jgi:hypothetical protein
LDHPGFRDPITGPDRLAAVGAPAAAGGLARRLDGGEQRGDQDGDDRDDDEQLDPREATNKCKY